MSEEAATGVASGAIPGGGETPEGDLRWVGFPGRSAAGQDSGLLDRSSIAPGDHAREGDLIFGFVGGQFSQGRAVIGEISTANEAHRLGVQPRSEIDCSLHGAL